MGLLDYLISIGGDDAFSYDMGDLGSNASSGPSLTDFFLGGSGDMPSNAYPMDMGIPDTGYTPTPRLSFGGDYPIDITQDTGYTPGPSAAAERPWYRPEWMDTANDIVSSPLGKLGVGGLGALISAYGANKQNKMFDKSAADAARAKAAQKAAFLQETAPMRVTNQRTAIPVWGANQRHAFDKNSLAAMTPRSTNTMYAAEGGSAKAEQPSLGGFLRYLANNRQFPETAEEKMARRVSELREKEARPMPIPTEAPSTTENIRRSLIREVPVEEKACGGLAHYVSGGTAGQDDKIPAMLSDGEYVMDADTVAALGDGNNAAGAKKLDKMRVGIRAHKRSAPPTKIPPKAKAPEAYLKGAK